MIFKKVTIPASGASTLKTSNFFDTEGRPIVGLTHFNSSFASTTPVNLKFQTPAVGQDHQNPSATWIDVLEISPGINTDADDAGDTTLESVRPALNLPALQFVQGGDEFFLIPEPYIPMVKEVPTADTIGAIDSAATNPSEAQAQQAFNQIARLSNHPFGINKFPNILRIAIVTDNAALDAAKDFYVALGEVVTPKPIRETNHKRITVSFANGDADSTYFELAPGERLAGIILPAAFTTTNLTLQTVKPTGNGPQTLDPAVITDANWLNLVQYPTDAPLFASAVPTSIMKWVGAAQAQYLNVPVLPYPEMPRYLRLHGSGNQGAARTVTLVIAS